MSELFERRPERYTQRVELAEQIEAASPQRPPALELLLHKDVAQTGFPSAIWRLTSARDVSFSIHRIEPPDSTWRVFDATVWFGPNPHTGEKPERSERSKLVASLSDREQIDRWMKRHRVWEWDCSTRRELVARLRATWDSDPIQI